MLGISHEGGPKQYDARVVIRTQNPWMNGNTTPQAAAGVTYAKNQPIFLAGEFLNEYAPAKLTARLIGTDWHEGGSSLGTAVAPYSPEGVLGWGWGPHTLDVPEGRTSVPPQFLYDYREDRRVQDEFTEMKYATLIGIRQLMSGSDVDVYVSENLFNVNKGDGRPGYGVHGKGYNAARTISLEHFHGFVVKRDELLPHSGKPAELTLEQKILSSVVPGSVARAVAGMPEGLGRNIDSIIINDQHPYMYSIVFDIREADIMSKIPQITDVMKWHHGAYIDIANEMFSHLPPRHQRTVFPVPSYVTVAQIGQNGKLIEHISPAVIARGGALERILGLDLNRDPRHPPKQSQKEIDDFRINLVQIVNDLLSNGNQSPITA